MQEKYKLCDVVRSQQTQNPLLHIACTPGLNLHIHSCICFKNCGIVSSLFRRHVYRE